MYSDPVSILRDLDTYHYARIPFNQSRAALNAAADAFMDFLALPDSIKRQLHFKARSHRASADGYTDKTLVDLKDPKQFFHWSPALMNRDPCPALMDTEPVVKRFFDHADQVYRAVEIALHDFYRQCLPDYVDRIFRDGRLIDGILRFLCYAPRPEHAFCAQAHFDKGFSTLALADSAPGLRIGLNDQHPLEPVTHSADSAIFMPAWMLFQASGGEIKPAWHDVVHRPEEQGVNEFCARWSVVFFVNDPQTPFSSWESVHTPLD